MALFGKKKETEKETAPKKAEAPSSAKKAEVAAEKENVPKATKQSVDVSGRDLSAIIVRPRVTEKAAIVGEHNVYTFEVRRDASKYDVRDAVKKLFKVTPIKVNVVYRKPRHFTSRMRGRKGVHPGMKKAYVYLKKGDKIDLV